MKDREKPETLRLRAVMPSLTVSDLRASVAWYRDVLGCVVGELMEPGGELVAARMRAGSVDFMLGQDDWAKGRDRVKGEGFRLYCVTRQEIDRVAEDIRARGGELDQEPTDQPWGARDLAVVDPDGFKITISSGLGN